MTNSLDCALNDIESQWNRGLKLIGSKLELNVKYNVTDEDIKRCHKYGHEIIVAPELNFKGK